MVYMSKDFRGDLATLMLTESELLKKKRDKLQKALDRIKENFSQAAFVVSDEDISEALSVIEIGRDVQEDNFLMSNIAGENFMIKAEAPSTFAIDLMRSISHYGAMKRVLPVNIEIIFKNESEKIRVKTEDLKRALGQGFVVDEEVDGLERLHDYLSSGCSAIGYLTSLTDAVNRGLDFDLSSGSRFFEILGRNDEYLKLLDLSEAVDQELITSHCQDLINDIRFNSLSGIKWDKKLIPDRDFIVLGAGLTGLYHSVAPEDRLARLGIAEHAAIMAVFGEYDFNPRNFLKSSKTGKIVQIDQSPLVNGFFSDAIDKRNSRLVGSFLTKDFLLTHLAQDRSRNLSWVTVQGVLDVEGEKTKPANSRNRHAAYLNEYRVDGQDLVSKIAPKIATNKELKEEFLHFAATLKKAFALSDDDALLDSYRSSIVEDLGSVAGQRITEQVAKLKLNVVEAKIMYGPLIALADEMEICDKKSSPLVTKQNILKLYQDRSADLVLLEAQVANQEELLNHQIDKLRSGLKFSDSGYDHDLSCFYFRQEDVKVLAKDKNLIAKERDVIKSRASSLQSEIKIEQEVGRGAIKFGKRRALPTPPSSSAPPEQKGKKPKSGRRELPAAPKTSAELKVATKENAAAPGGVLER